MKITGRQQKIIRWFFNRGQLPKLLYRNKDDSVTVSLHRKGKTEVVTLDTDGRIADVLGWKDY